MRNLVLRLAFVGAVLTLGACADNPTQSDQQRALDPGGRRGPLPDENSVQCTGDAVCLDPIIEIGDPRGDGGGLVRRWRG
ncbi:MAG TPA: hypothetical protein VHG93_06865 [Longimicrobium sp.]|nr:hypothetical protein [Longimicrobium sp.]